MLIPYQDETSSSKMEEELAALQEVHHHVKLQLLFTDNP